MEYAEGTKVLKKRKSPTYPVSSNSSLFAASRGFSLSSNSPEGGSSKISSVPGRNWRVKITSFLEVSGRIQTKSFGSKISKSFKSPLGRRKVFLNTSLQPEKMIFSSCFSQFFTMI